MQKCKNIFFIIYYRNNYISKNLQLFCLFISNPKKNKGKIENNKEDKNNHEVKNEINNNKYASAFLFSTFKLLEKVRNIF